MSGSSMRSTWILRIAAGVFGFYAVTHTFGAMYVDIVTAGPGKQAVFAVMRGHTEDFMGSMRSYWDFYIAFGFYVGWSLAAFAVLSWQLARLARTSPTSARPLIFTLFAISIPMTVLTWTHLFETPQILSTLGTLFLGAAALDTSLSRRSSSLSTPSAKLPVSVA